MTGVLSTQPLPPLRRKRQLALGPGYTQGRPFALTDLGRVKPVAGAWWADAELHVRCLGDLEPMYFRKDGKPAAIVARFSVPVRRSQAAEMLMLASRSQIIVNALPSWAAIRA